MTAKDLNLSFDQGLLQSTNRTALTSSGTREPVGSPFSETRTAKSSWGATAFIALLNIAIVLGVGYWFVELSGKMPISGSAASAEGNQAIRTDLAELNIQISALQDEIRNLRLAQNEQGELLRSSIQEIPLPTEKPQKKSNIAKEKPIEVAKLVEDINWYVNLGSFTSSGEADRLRKKMLAIGYQPEIKRQKVQNQMSYKVVLPGFKNRESAEVAAKLLMEQTDLDSLWVWQGSEEA